VAGLRKAARLRSAALEQSPKNGHDQTRLTAGSKPAPGSPTIVFGTLLVVAAIGACVSVLFGKETVGQLETVSEGVPEPA
jgi:hypothetical protein